MLDLLSCGYHHVHPDGITIDRPKGAGNYAFVFFKSRAEVIVRGRSMNVEPGTHIVFGPNTPHLYRELERPFANDWFHCVGEEMGALMAELEYPLDEPVKAVDALQISRGVIELRRVQSNGGRLAGRILDLELRGFMMKLANATKAAPLPEKVSGYYGAFVDLRSSLFNAPHERTSVEELASRVNLSKSYFQHSYKQFFGVPVMTDMIAARLEYAKYLLKNSRLSVAEVASLCGYDNDTHFMRQFKKYVRVTPKRYRDAGAPDRGPVQITTLEGQPFTTQDDGRDSLPRLQ
ncbi:AraC family transcriptional regulator [Cohnella sp. JJ-181]|uniref:AraC family transcriptional regulator n=1 Tax=Cohnella rhizoplanae TaxID=2974897 RepID=UPI0022FF5702|nr:AraC family transcriptional regulator [Cohnella sp. JJ-181]CAI6049012.1 HTH-type transcriptional activator RhaR [Cohnella sp. JJ-181]